MASNSTRSTEEDGTERSVNAVLVGCGRAGVQLHYGAFRSRGVNYVAVCDTNQQVAHDTAHRLGIAYSYSNLAEALDSHQIDHVDIATPPSTHAKLSIEAMEAGKDVFVEKPMTETVAEADMVREVQQRTGRKLVIAHNHKFTRGIRRAHALYNAGEVGELLHLAHNWMFTGLKMQEESHRMMESDHWAHRFPGGLLLEGNPHSLYIAYGFAGELSLRHVAGRKVSGNWPHIVADEIDVLLENETASVNIRYSLNMDQPVHKGGFQGGLLMGTRGVLVYDYSNCVEFRKALGAPPILGIAGIRRKIASIRRQLFTSRRTATVPDDSGERINIGLGNGFNQLAGETLHYFHSDGAEPPVTWEEAYFTVRLNQEIGQSVEHAVRAEVD